MSQTMGDFQYPVFIECRGLREEQVKKIEQYFRIRRKSGGGDCGPVRRVADNVYSVAFKNQGAQQAVLQRYEHVVEGLVFTVRGTSSPITTSAEGQDFTAPVQSPQFIPASTLPPSGEEYELQPDSYLLRYLKECPKAERELEKELASVACSAQLYPEEGRILVRSTAQPGPVDEVRKWKAEVDKLFDGYQCHYELDPHKVKALLQSCSSCQPTDEVKVYSEVGLAVVVGKRSQVIGRLMDAEDRSGLSEKQTTICRLGKAKLHLLWEHIEHSLGRDFPAVKVTQGNAGRLVLEGSVEEILKARNWISEKEKLVLERKVSDVSPHFLAFLRKAYGCPGVLGDFLGIGDKVEVELRDRELCFFSLFADKLDDTDRKLRGKFKELKIDVSNCSSVPSALRNKLKSKTNELNQGQYRAEVVFGSDNMVCLLGHTKEVEELRETVTQFNLDQTSSHSKVHPPVPDLIQELPEVRYFQSHTGTDELQNVTRNLSSLSLSEVNTIVASYSLRDDFQVLVCQGDITKQDADALVNAANEDLDHCVGVAAALSKAGGPEVQRESNALVKSFGKIPTGDVVVTTGGKLNCKNLLHAVGPVGATAGGLEWILLGKTIHTALNLAEMKRFKSIAMPCISSGTSGVPVDVCSEAIVTAVKRFGSQGGRSLNRVILIDMRKEVVRAMREACDRLLQGTCPENSAPRHLGFPMEVSAHGTAGGATAEAPGDNVHVEIIQGTIETQQVDAVVTPMVDDNPFSTRVGQTLFKMGGPQLTARFREEAGKETLPGGAVLVEGVPRVPFHALFFLNLIPWDDDQDGTAVQLLRLGINTILSSCENRGFGSVALPVLGAGIVLRFPASVVARVLLEEVHEFKKSRAGRTPFLVRIVIHPSDKAASEAFKSAQEAIKPKGFTGDLHEPHKVSTTRRIVLLGKTGSGKSNLANTIFGEKLFTTDHSPNSGTRKCQAETKSVNTKSVTLIDTPGFFDTEKSEEDTKPEIMRCIIECAPGPHAFLIVLKVEKFTEQEQDVISKICQYLTEDALKYAVIVFTHGNQLPEGMKIDEFVSQNKSLSDLVKKCGGRCHVFDNKYWKNKMQDNYRNNQFQVEALLQTIDKILVENTGGFYINKMWQAVEDVIQKEEEQIRQSSGNMPVEEIRKQAKTSVFERCQIQLAGIATGALLGAFFGVAKVVELVFTALHYQKTWTKVVGAGGAVAVALGLGAVAGVVAGGIIGHNAADGAETTREAAQMTANAIKKREATLSHILHHAPLGPGRPASSRSPRPSAEPGATGPSPLPPPPSGMNSPNPSETPLPSRPSRPH